MSGAKILTGMREAVVYARGENREVRETVIKIPPEIDVKKLNERLKMTQKKRMSAAEKIAWHTWQDVADIRDARYQPTQWSSPVFLLGDDYWCAGDTPAKPIRGESLKWQKIESCYGDYKFNLWFASGVDKTEKIQEISAAVTARAQADGVVTDEDVEKLLS